MSFPLVLLLSFPVAERQGQEQAWGRFQGTGHRPGHRPPQPRPARRAFYDRQPPQSECTSDLVIIVFVVVEWCPKAREYWQQSRWQQQRWQQQWQQRPRAFHVESNGLPREALESAGRGVRGQCAAKWGAERPRGRVVSHETSARSSIAART